MHVGMLVVGTASLNQKREVSCLKSALHSKTSM